MEVIWTDMATQQLGNIVKYVESEFGRSIAVKTLDKINSKIIRLSHFPESGIFDRTMSDDKYTMRHINGSLKFEITAKRLYAASQRVL